MIRVIYYPVRFEKAGKQEFEFPYNRNNPLKFYLEATEIEFLDCDVIVNGKNERNFNKSIDNDDEIIITPKVKWGAIVALVKVIWTFALAHPYMFWISAVSMSYSLYSALSARTRLPNFGSFGDGLDESSPTYGWDGIRTIQEVGVPVKVVSGRHRTGGNILNQFISTDGDKNYLNLLIGVCEGEIESIGEVKINDQPIANFEGVDVVTRLGTNDQTVIPNFENLHNVYPINVQLTKDNAYDYTTVDSDVEGFEIKLSLPSGLFQVDSGNGAILSWQVTYNVKYRIHGGGAYTDLGSFTIDGKSRSAMYRIFKKYELAAGQYDIQITRTSDNSSLDPQMNGDLYLDYVDEIKTDDLVYPNTALIGIKALATEQLSGSTPNVTFVVEGSLIRIPDVLTELGGDPVDWEDYYYDPDTELFRLFSDDSALYWDETTYVEKWSANPIWFHRHLCLHTRYGLGNYIETENMNDAELLEYALYCEEKVPDGNGGYEKRFRLDVVIDSPVKAPDLFSQLTATFRGFPLYSEGGFSFKIDKPEVPTQVFGMGNIIKDNFQQSWKSKKEVYNVFEIQFCDEEMDYQDETIVVIDEDALANGDPVRKKQIRLFVTKKSYAIREGRYAKWVGKYINRGLSFKASIDAIACQAGHVINLSHDVPQWGFSGRVESGSTTTKVKLDRTVVLDESKSYNVMVRFSDDTIEERIVTDPAGSYTEVNVSVAFSNVPQAYDVYSVGEVDKIVKPYRVIGIRREGRGEVALNAVEYNENVYDDSDVIIPTNNYSALVNEIPYVTNLSLTERMVKLRDGTIENVIDVWFTKPSMIGYNVGALSKARIYLSDNDGDSWIFKGETFGNHFQVIGDIIDLQDYKVVVTSINSAGQETAIANSPSSIISIVGKSAPPSDISSFIVNQDKDRMRFSWTEIDDVDVFGYEIRKGDSWGSGELVAFVQGNSYMTTDLRLGVEQDYWIKAFDTSGNYSENATQATLTIESIPYRNIVEEFSEQTAWSGDKVDTEVSGDNLIISSGELTGTYETPERDMGYLASFSLLAEVITAISESLAFDSDAGKAFDDDPTLRFTGTEAQGAYSLEIRTSEDDITWTSYAPFQKGDYYCRYFQLRLTLTRESVETSLICSQFNYWADLPDVNEIQDGEVTVAGDGDDITFTKTFHQDPVVSVTILTGSGVYWKETGLDTTGVNIKLYDASGTAQTGTLRIHIYGI